MIRRWTDLQRHVIDERFENWVLTIELVPEIPLVRTLLLVALGMGGRKPDVSRERLNMSSIATQSHTG